jgi:hypothetical protein
MFDLTEKEFLELLATIRTTCPECNSMSHRDYCRRCGTRFWRCGCRDEHDKHKTYTRALLGIN